MSPQRRVTWLSSNPWGKRAAVFVTGAACAAMLLLGLWLESKWLVAGAVATGGGAFALLLLLVFRRVGYLIVLHRATGQGLSLLAEEQMRLKDGLDRLSGRQGRLEDSVNHLSRAQQRLAGDLVRWGLPGYRELLLGAYREHAQSQESIGEAVSKAKDQLAQVQQRIDRLQADMGVLSRSLDQMADMLAEISRQSGSVDQHVKRALSELKTAREVVSARSEAMQGLLEKIDRNIEARLAAKIDKVTHAIDNGDLRFPLLNDINAMNRLQQRFSPPASLPMMSGWALDAVSLERLIEAVLEHRPRTIVECGSGVSTVWLAYAAREFGGKVVALEHKEKFAEQTRDDLRRHGLLDVADVRLAPLEDIEFDGQVFPWYCKEAWRDLSGIDMLLVDGPPKATGPRARYPALPALGSSLSNGCVVVFDDINRKDEKEILDSWLEAYPKLGKPVAIGDRTVLMEWGAVSSDEHGRS